jgi:MarR family transcriptional regulator, organic hydroperoxide resistance regulator
MEGIFAQSQTDPYPIDQSIGGTMSQIMRALNPLLENRVQPYGISQGTWFFIRALWDQDGVSQRQLAYAVGASAPTTLAALRNLEAGGFVALKSDARDRRRTIIYLTPKGRDLQHKLIPAVASINPKVLKGLSRAEVQNLLRVLQILKRNAQEAFAAERAAQTGGQAA